MPSINATRRPRAIADSATPRAPRGRFILALAAGLVLLATPLAQGAGEGGPLEGGERNPTANASAGYIRETQIIGNIAQNQGGFSAGTGGFVTRQSNKSDTGGGAIYGCRARAGAEACVAANNLSNGSAFRFQSSAGAATIGVLRYGLNINQLVAKPPFATNATGVVANLNADKLDDKSAEDFALKASVDDLVPKGSLLFATVAADGAITSSRGVPANAKATVATMGGDQVFTVPFTGDLSKCAYTASPTDVRASTVAVAPGTDKSTVVVTEDSGTRYGFHLQVTC